MPFDKYPAAMTNNARRGLELNKKVNGKCATDVGRETARILSNRETISDERLVRMYSYLQRAETYYNPSDTKACGTISFLMWGGLAAKRWSEARWNEMQEERQLSGPAKKGLQNKVKEHNESVTVPHKKATLSMLEKVYNRGVGAYKTNPESVRPSVSSPEQWAMARVNSFLYALKNEKFKGGSHDTDLFPEGHKLRTGKEEEQKMDNHEKNLRHQYGDSVESRMMKVEAREEENKMILEGYAARFNEETDLGYFREKIERGAFSDVMGADVRFLLNHSGMPMARTSNGTLTMSVDDEGLYTRAELNDTQQSRDVYAAVKRGDINAMSFAFTIKEDAMDTDTNTRTVLKVKEMYDVSAVSFPAYPTTTLEARDRAAAQQMEAVEESDQTPQEETTQPEAAPEIVQPEQRTFEDKSQRRMNLNDLKGQRVAYYEEFVSIGQTVEAEGRNMTEAEQERADKLDGMIKGIDQKIAHKQREQEMVKRAAYSGAPSASEQKEVSAINHRWSLSRAINSIRSNDRLEGAEAEWAAEAQREFRHSGIQMAGEIGIPAFALARTTGSADSFMASGTGDGSGFVSTDVPFAIEALRAPTVLEQLGAITVQAQGNLKFPRVSSPAVAQVEASEITDVDAASMELDDLTLSPQRAAMHTTYSKQLLTQGGAEVDRLIAGDLRREMAEVIDTQGLIEILAGAASDFSSAGANDTAVSGDLAVELEAGILAEGASLEGAAYVMSPTAYRLFKTTPLIDSVAPLFDGGLFNGYKAVATPHLADETADTVGQVIFGNFAQGCIIAYFGGIDILVDPFSKATNAQVQLHATRYFDVGVRQGGAFAKCVDVKA